MYLFGRMRPSKINTGIITYTLFHLWISSCHGRRNIPTTGSRSGHNPRSLWLLNHRLYHRGGGVVVLDVECEARPTSSSSTSSMISTSPPALASRRRRSRSIGTKRSSSFSIANAAATETTSDDDDWGCSDYTRAQSAIHHALSAMEDHVQQHVNANVETWIERHGHVHKSMHKKIRKTTQRTIRNTSQKIIQQQQQQIHAATTTTVNDDKSSSPFWKWLPKKERSHSSSRILRAVENAEHAFLKAIQEEVHNLFHELEQQHNHRKNHHNNDDSTRTSDDSERTKALVLAKQTVQEGIQTASVTAQHIRQKRRRGWFGKQKPKSQPFFWKTNIMPPSA